MFAAGDTASQCKNCARSTGIWSHEPIVWWNSNYREQQARTSSYTATYLHDVNMSRDGTHSLSGARRRTRQGHLVVLYKGNKVSSMNSFNDAHAALPNSLDIRKRGYGGAESVPRGPRLVGGVHGVAKRPHLSVVVLSYAASTDQFAILFKSLARLS
eukprot:6188016-Pleurochrysis_carterae.AAC.1